MEPAFHLVLLEPGLLKDLRVREEVDLCSGLPRLSDHRKQAVLQLFHRNTPLVFIMMDKAVAADPDLKGFRERVDHGGTHTVETAAGLICVIVKLTACMQRSQHKPGRAHPFFMHSHRNPPAVVLYRTRPVLFQRYPDLRAEPREMLIHGVVHDLIDQMV